MSTQPERLQLTEASSSYFAQTGRYLWRHRDKIAVGGAVCAAGLVIYYSLSKKSTENEDEKKILAEVKRRRPGDRSRMLLRIRKQFDFAIRQFLPTMHTRILEVVDVSSAIRKIKELRTANGESNRSSEDSSAFMRTEALLWDEIKVSSLTLVYVSAYMVSAVTVLLRIQLHILGKSMESVLQSQSNVEESESNLGADDVFKILIEGTYKHIFGTGLQALSDYVRPRVMECFAEWNVRDNLAVDFDDLAQTMSRVHRNIERDSTSLAKMIMLPPEAELGETMTNMESTPKDPPVQQLLSQTWDVIESPMFAAVFAEAADTALRSIVNHLKCKVFTEESDVDDYGPPRARTPPLARLLPQLKFAALRLLPSDPTAPISSDVLEMISNPVLDTLCVSLFDLGMEQTNSSNQAMSQSTRNGSSSGDGSGKTVERPDGNSGTNWPH